jgi:hypothetical protein
MFLNTNKLSTDRKAGGEALPELEHFEWEIRRNHGIKQITPLIYDQRGIFANIQLLY